MLKKSLLPGLVLLGIIITIRMTYPWLQKQASIPHAQWTLAQSGVQHNAEWEPVIRQYNGIDWALVPAGCFNRGSTELQREQALLACKAYGGENCPYVFDQPIKQTCFDSPYWISVTEITNQQFGSSSSTDMHTMYRGSQWPRETLTWQQANAFCESISARLPFEAEWEFAARGPDNLLYPWGNAMSNEYQAQSTRLNPYDVDELQIDTSWVGAHGMAGNVAEWVMDVFKADSPQRVTRGGSWASYADFLLRTTQRIPYMPDYKASILGFRCVMTENLE